MARGKHGWNNTIESRLLIKGGNLAKLVPARRAASANPDISTSDLHHSSPRARINRPLTPCKSLPCKLPWFGRVQAWKHCIQIKTHIHVEAHRYTHTVPTSSHQRLHTCTGRNPSPPCSALKTATVAVTLNQSETSLIGRGVGGLGASTECTLSNDGLVLCSRAA